MTAIPQSRGTLQDLLAERRANVLEQAAEKDAIAVALLQYHIDDIDREIRRRAGSLR